MHTLNKVLSLIVLTTIWPANALAYVGPGAGLSVIGSLLAIVAAVILALIGFVFYPLRRMFRKKRTKKSERETERNE